MTTHLPTLSLRRRQQGIALIMAIILLIIATLTGLAGMRNTTLQERLSANLYDRAIAMQAAEFALVAAEKDLFTVDYETVIYNLDGNFSFVIKCPGSVPDKPDIESECPPVDPFLPDSANPNWKTVALPETTDKSFNKNLKAGNPQYFIQYLGLKSNAPAGGTFNSANCLQEGSGDGCGNDTGQNSTKNPTFRVTVRSSTPTADNDRSIVVLTSLVKSN